MSPDALSGWRAERRRTLRKRGVPLQVAPTRRAIPSCLRETEKAYGVPGAAKNTGDDARPLFDNRIGSRNENSAREGDAWA